MDSLGSDFREIFDDNTGLAPDRVQDLSNATGMRVEYQRCETPDSILQLLQNYGPLVIIDDEDPSPAFAVHARIVRGIYGDGDAANTHLKIVDPDGGKTYDESFQDFTSKYEAMADATNGHSHDLRDETHDEAEVDLDVAGGDDEWDNIS